jgi:hypothetical protein
MSKGPLKATEVMHGSKCLSSKRPPANTSHGKMSSAHGVVPPGPTKGMSNPSGRLGASTRAFKSNLTSTTGGLKNDTRQAKQPKGHSA